MLNGKASELKGFKIIDDLRFTITLEYKFAPFIANLESLSRELGLGYQALSARMRGMKAFELPEIYKLMNKYNRPFDYLFSENVHQDAS